MGMDKQFHPTPYIGYNYLSMLGLKLICISNMGTSLLNIINVTANDIWKPFNITTKENIDITVCHRESHPYAYNEINSFWKQIIRDML